MDVLTAATLEKALSGIATKAVTPLLQRAARAAASRLNLRKPDFVEAYRIMLGARSNDVSVLSLYRAMPAGLTLSEIKKALNSPSALGFIRQLTAIHIIGNTGTQEQRGARDASRDRIYQAFSSYLAEVFDISYSESAGKDGDDSRLHISGGNLTYSQSRPLGCLIGTAASPQNVLPSRPRTEDTPSRGPKP